MIRASYTLRAATAIAISAALGGPAAAGAQEDGGLPAIESHTAGFERLDGFFPLYWDDDAGTLWLEIGRLGVEVLYVNALAAGVGFERYRSGSRAARRHAHRAVRAGRPQDPDGPAELRLPRRPPRTRTSGGRWRTPSPPRFCSGSRPPRAPTIVSSSTPRRSCCATSTALRIACPARTGSTPGAAPSTLPGRWRFPRTPRWRPRSRSRARAAGTDPVSDAAPSTR